MDGYILTKEAKKLQIYSSSSTQHTVCCIVSWDRNQDPKLHGNQYEGIILTFATLISEFSISFAHASLRGHSK